MNTQDEKTMKPFFCYRLFTKALFFVILLFGSTGVIWAASSGDMEKVWKDFRSQYPYGYQVVGLRHLGNECVFVISEPSESVQESSLNLLFNKHKGTAQIKRIPFGYDGWLADYIGCAEFGSEDDFNQFTKELFDILYGTDYKAHYLDLDRPQTHVFFSRQNLNYSISAAELEEWMLTESEPFANSKGQRKSMAQLLSARLEETNELWYSENRGFVIWCFNGRNTKSDSTFKQNARKFALDSDLIVGAIGRKGENYAIIARERNISTGILPPLRIETIQLLFNTKNPNLAQSYERYHVFAGKTHLQQDVAPIYLSDELWHTEYGNLLNITDQMLKSWSENGTIEYSAFGYPKPIDWAFNSGAVSDLGTSELTYNWNTAGAGYVIEGDNFDIYAVNRTGSLPVSYIPGGMEGKVDESINEAEELAYDFFSELSSPELVRVVQYASLYQIFRYFVKDEEETNTYGSSVSDCPEIDSSHARLFSEDLSISRQAPDYSCLEPYVERLLRIASNIDKLDDKVIDSAFGRYYQIALQNNPYTRLKELSSKDDSEERLAFLKAKMGSEYVDSLLNTPPSIEDFKKEFHGYLDPNLRQVNDYIKQYSESFGAFPYSKAAHYIVNPRKITIDVEAICNRSLPSIKEYSAKVDAFNEKVDKYNSTNITPLTVYHMLSIEKQSIEDLGKLIERQQEIDAKEALSIQALSFDNTLSQSFAALNWLLTDSGSNTEPIGEFYTAFFKSNHNHWIKSPSIACSFNSIGYGGHNLDAHVTPVRFSNDIRPGKCKVNIVDGQRVISVSKSDRARVTPTVLRQVERRISTDQEITLPEAPPVRPKTVLFGEISNRITERGFSPEIEIAEVTPSKTVRINETECGTLDDLFTSISEAVANGMPIPVKEIRYKGMSAREVQVQVDNLRECILERSLDNEAVLKDFDINAIDARINEDGQAIISLPQKAGSIPDNTYKAGIMEFQVPAGSEELFKSIIKKVYDMPEEKVDNHFKMMRQIRLELEKHPEIQMDDVKDEYIRLFGFIMDRCNQSFSDRHV